MKNFFSFLSRSSQKKILCLDGGGVRTIAALVFLKKLESESGKKVSDMFDMFIGTSAGSLNAACFAYGEFSAEKVKTFWSKKYLDKIMKSSFFWDKASLIQARPRYENKGRMELDHMFPYSLGGDSGEDNFQTLCRSCNLAKGNSIFSINRWPTD